MLLASVFFLLIPRVFPLNFSFTSFKDNDRISYENSARLAVTFIDLVTHNTEGNVGRATYHQPMHLWDKATGKITDFTTNFTFVIDSQDSSEFGDGMAFFLAPKDSKLPNFQKAAGGSLGLIIGGQETILNSIDHPFVAVEFDIFPNEWDSPCVHVGVDINSINSVTDVAWKSDIMGGRKNEAFISYNASTHNLSILFTGFDHSNKIVWQHLHQIVDQAKYLPEWVTFGFSAAIGQYFATHKIKKWSFYSEDFPNVAPNSNPRPSLNLILSLSSSQTSTNAIALATGLGVGGLILVCGVVLFVMWKN